MVVRKGKLPIVCAAVIAVRAASRLRGAALCSAAAADGQLRGSREPARGSLCRSYRLALLAAPAGLDEQGLWLAAFTQPCRCLHSSAAAGAGIAASAAVVKAPQRQLAVRPPQLSRGLQHQLPADEGHAGGDGGSVAQPAALVEPAEGAVQQAHAQGGKTCRGGVCLLWGDCQP